MAEKRATKQRWVRDVKTVSTYPPEGTFTKDAETIARTMASKKVSPKGIGSGIRMIQFFINRAGKNLPPERKRELEKAKKLLQAKLRKEKRPLQGGIDGAIDDSRLRTCIRLPEGEPAPGQAADARGDGDPRALLHPDGEALSAGRPRDDGRLR
jgi:tRNA(adenine34) deaminase